MFTQYFNTNSEPERKRSNYNGMDKTKTIKYKVTINMHQTLVTVFEMVARFS